MVPVIVLQSALAIVSSLAAVACVLLLRATHRERRMSGGQLAACREHRADAKRFADDAKAHARDAAASVTIRPFCRDE